jgi:hypothetical protein
VAAFWSLRVSAFSQRLKASLLIGFGCNTKQKVL